MTFEEQLKDAYIAGFKKRNENKYIDAYKAFQKWYPAHVRRLNLRHILETKLKRTK